MTRHRTRPLAAAATLLALALPALAADVELQKKVDELSQQVQSLREQVKGLDAAPAESAEPKAQWVTFGGDLRVRHDILRGKVPSYSQYQQSSPLTPQSVDAKTVSNGSLWTNRFGFDIHAKPVESVTLTARMLAYKTFGMADQGATQTGFFADRQNSSFDGSLGHVPASNALLLDRAYATVNNLFEQPVWFSAGRRPSTGGIPTNIRDNREVSGVSGTPGLLVDYAFDGMTLGAAPEVEKLPGFAAKLCYGRAYESGYAQRGVTPRDTDMLGAGLLLLETPDTRLEAQYQRGFNIMETIPGPNVRTNLGDLEEIGGNLVQTMRDLGPGDLTVFGSGALSNALPNGNRYDAGFGAGNPGLMCDGAACGPTTGWAMYAGLRYDVKKTRTKLGAEYNHGSKNWITFVPAGDDVWTSKLGTRGNVYELYGIQELGRAPMTRDGKVFFRLGWQYYDFSHTGSNSWVGAPKSIKDLTASQIQFQAPLRSAYDVYSTFEVRF